MENYVPNRIRHKIEDSADRMDDILDANDNDYEDEGNSIPSRDKLTYKNGYYVDVTAIFIDIVDSSKLTDGHKRPTLAKMYRCFLSECVAVMNSYEICKEINIKVIEVAAKLNDMIKLLNYKLKKKKYESISTGIGIDDGNALMVKAGYSGSGLKDAIWMGEVVNSACHLANKAGRGWRKNVIISEKVYENISKDVQDYFSKCQIDSKTYYESDILWIEYEDWIEQNCN